MQPMAVLAYKQWYSGLSAEERYKHFESSRQYHKEHPEHQHRASEASMSPEARARCREGQRKPEAVAKMSAAGKARWDDLTYRAKVIPQLSERARERWADPAYREAQIKKLIAGRKPKPRPSCGTTAGYFWHYTHKDPICNLCRQARKDYRRGKGH
jgi:hypothetical protein